MNALFDGTGRLETLEEFRARTWFVREPQFRDGFAVSPGVSAKVAPEDGAFLPYVGNTAVLRLPEEVRREAEVYQRAIYDRAGWCLSRPIPPETFHITLHDLVSGPPSPELELRVAAIEGGAKELTRAVASSGGTLRLRSVGVYCLAGTSLVLGVEPQDEDSCRLLMSAYALFERLLPLGYPLTPHITLGYLRPLNYTRGHIEALRSAVAACGELRELRFTLSVEALEYWMFSDMGAYQS